jgi:hypothetical protein
VSYERDRKSNDDSVIVDNTITENLGSSHPYKDIKPSFSEMPIDQVLAALNKGERATDIFSRPLPEVKPSDSIQ